LQFLRFAWAILFPCSSCFTLIGIRDRLTLQGPTGKSIVSEIEKAEWRRAVHEAGHAVMAVLWGVDVLKLTMDGLEHGRASKDAIMQIAASGRAAQILLGDFSEEDWREDLELIDDMILNRFSDPKARRIHKDILLARCERLLQESWPAVEALATALLAYGRLSGTQVRKIIKGLA
jgi:hypothetical protein